MILACAPKRDPIYAIKAGGSGVLDDDAIAWASRDVREVSGLLFMVAKEEDRNGAQSRAAESEGNPSAAP